MKPLFVILLFVFDAAQNYNKQLSLLQTLFRVAIKEDLALRVILRVRLESSGNVRSEYGSTCSPYLNSFETIRCAGSYLWQPFLQISRTISRENLPRTNLIEAQL